MVRQCRHPVADIRIAQRPAAVLYLRETALKKGRAGKCLVEIETQLLRGCLVSWNDLGHWHQIQVTVMPESSCLTFSKLFNFLSLSILICKMGVMISVSLDKHSISICCHSPFGPSSQPCFPEPNKYHLPASTVPTSSSSLASSSQLCFQGSLPQEERSQSPQSPPYFTSQSSKPSQYFNKRDTFGDTLM